MHLVLAAVQTLHWQLTALLLRSIQSCFLLEEKNLKIKNANKAESSISPQHAKGGRKQITPQDVIFIRVADRITA